MSLIFLTSLKISLIYSRCATNTKSHACYGAPRALCASNCDSAGGLSLPLWGGSNAPSWTWIFQAATYDGTGYDLSNGLEVVIGSF